MESEGVVYTVGAGRAASEVQAQMQVHKTVVDQRLRLTFLSARPSGRRGEDQPGCRLVSRQNRILGSGLILLLAVCSLFFGASAAPVAG